MKLGKAKNNQAKSFFSYKNDDVELVDIGQFLRETTNYRVEREWYILFNKMTGEYMLVIRKHLTVTQNTNLETLISY